MLSNVMLPVILWHALPFYAVMNHAMRYDAMRAPRTVSTWMRYRRTTDANKLLGFYAGVTH